MIKLLIGALFILVTTQGCGPSSFGKNFAGFSIVKTIQVGTTDQEQIRRIMGAPRGIGRAYLPPLGSLDVWEYDHVALAGGDVQQKLMLIFFDSDKRVQAYLFYGGLVEPEQP